MSLKTEKFEVTPASFAVVKKEVKDAINGMDAFEIVTDDLTFGYFYATLPSVWGGQRIDKGWNVFDTERQEIHPATAPQVREEVGFWLDEAITYVEYSGQDAHEYSLRVHPDLNTLVESTGFRPSFVNVQVASIARKVLSSGVKSK